LRHDQQSKRRPTGGEDLLDRPATGHQFLVWPEQVGGRERIGGARPWRRAWTRALPATVGGRAAGTVGAPRRAVGRAAAIPGWVASVRRWASARRRRAAPIGWGRVAVGWRATAIASRSVAV
jgi:hypothetical protein